MSRIGKMPVAIPQGVEVSANGRELNVKGKLGTLSWDIPHEVRFDIADGNITFAPVKDDKRSRAMWGLSRAKTANLVTGVSEGFSKDLELKGVGYRANMQGKNLNLTVGFSHPVNMEVPEGLTVAVEDTTKVSIKGIDKEVVGQFAANVRRVRPPEPYKGKGIRYKGEEIILKEGKKK